MKFTLKDILNLDSEMLSGMTTAELKDVTKVLYSSANKRISQLQKSELGKISPVLKTRAKQVKRTAKAVNKQITKAKAKAKANGKRFNVKKVSSKNLSFSTKGRTRNQVLRDINQARELVENKASTTRGMQEITSELSERLMLDKDLSASQTKRFWKLYNQIETHDLNPKKGARSNSNRVQELIARMVAQPRSRYVRNDEILLQAQSLADDLYESEVEMYEQWKQEEEYLDLEEENFLDYDDDEIPF